METKIFTIRDPQRDRAAIEAVASILRSGGLAAIPTETVYGLAADGLNPEAVASIYRAKGRPSDNPLILHVDQAERMRPLVTSIPPEAQALIDRFWPGPLTLILPKTDRVPAVTAGGLDTVAVRCPSHPIAHAIIAAAGTPLAAPSANLSGKPSPTTFRDLCDDLTGRVDALVDAGDCGIGVESTVLTLADGRPRVLRPGGVSLEALRTVLPATELDTAVLHEVSPDTHPASPGMKYKHYAPKAHVILLEGDLAGYVRYVNAHAAPGVFALCFEGEQSALAVPAVLYGLPGDPESQAHRLFAALREVDRRGARTGYARTPDREGVGLAVYNRLLRSAGFEVIEV